MKKTAYDNIIENERRLINKRAQLKKITRIDNVGRIEKDFYCEQYRVCCIL